MRRTGKAELVVEYAVLLSMVVVTLVTLQAYMKRGIQGMIKVTADDLGVPAETHYNLKTNPLQGGSGLNLNSQLLGAWEQGLIDYSKPGTGRGTATASVPPEVVTTVDQQMNLKETPPSAAWSPIRTTTIANDQTHTTGEWKMIYLSSGAGTFAAADKMNLPESGINNNPGGGETKK